MSRIAGIVNQTANQSVEVARKALVRERDELALWVTRFESSDQCDDEDREAIALAKRRVKQLDRLSLLTWATGE